MSQFGFKTKVIAQASTSKKAEARDDAEASASFFADGRRTRTRRQKASDATLAQGTAAPIRRRQR